MQTTPSIEFDEFFTSSPCERCGVCSEIVAGEATRDGQHYADVWARFGHSGRTLVGLVLADEAFIAHVRVNGDNLEIGWDDAPQVYGDGTRALTREQARSHRDLATALSVVAAVARHPLIADRLGQSRHEH